VPESSNPLAVAILQTSQEGGHLKQALQELGAAVVYEAPPASIDRDKLESSGARVVIVNLDADSDAYIDSLYDVLDAGDYEVVFNDAQVSSNLQGWDHARWARNLAAKLLHKPEIAEPPRPPGSVPVPTPMQKLVHDVPIAEKPGPREAVTAELPVAERPTIEMPVPHQLRSDPEPMQPGELDIGALGDFADLTAPQVEVSAEAAAMSAEPAEPAAHVPDDFAAELDALFAAADAQTAPPAPAPSPSSSSSSSPFDAPTLDAGGGLDFDLPAEFNLVDMPEEPSVQTAPGIDIDIPFGNLAAEAPPKPAPAAPAAAPAMPKLPPLQNVAPGGFDDFPAIFDQLDLAADVPEATDGSFKPAALPDKPAAATATFPTDWGLEDFDLGADAGGKPGAPAKLERLSAADFLAPEVDEGNAVKLQETMPAAGLGGLELLPM